MQRKNVSQQKAYAFPPMHGKCQYSSTQANRVWNANYRSRRHNSIGCTLCKGNKVKTIGVGILLQEARRGSITAPNKRKSCKSVLRPSVSVKKKVINTSFRLKTVSCAQWSARKLSLLLHNQMLVRHLIMQSHATQTRKSKPHAD